MLLGARGGAHLRNGNAAADALELTADQLRRLAALPEPLGDRYEDMAPLGR
jgi:hypothetical protein